MNNSFNLGAIDITPKLHKSVNIISAYGPGYIIVKERKYRGNLIVTRSEIHESDYVDFSYDILENHQIILFGSDNEEERMSFKKFLDSKNNDISFEIMNTVSAYRTYNVLISEGREVVMILKLSDDYRATKSK